MFFDRKPLDDYIPEISPEKEVPHSPTTYRYCGNWMVWDCSEQQRRSFKRLSFIGIFVVVLLFLHTGTLRSVSNTCRPVAVCSLLSAVALLCAATGLLSFSWKQDRLPEYDFHLLSIKLNCGLLAHFLLLLASFCFSVRCSLSVMPGGRSIELRTAFGYLLCSCISLFLYLRLKKLSYHRELGS